MADPDRFVARLRRRLFVGEFLHVAAGWLAGFLIAFGLTVLSVKLFAPQWASLAFSGGLLILPLLGFIAWRASRRVPEDREAIALLDQRLKAGGLLMTLSERPDPRWKQRLPSPEKWTAALPQIRPVRFARAIAVPALFAAGAGFMPIREEASPAPQATAATDAAAELTEAFELLERADALEEESKATLKQELDQLVAEAQDKPLTHEKWETVDALRERMLSGLDATTMSVSQGRAAVAALAAAVGRPLATERTEQLQQDLAEALETLRKNGAFDHAAGMTAANLPPEVQRLLKNGEFKLPPDAAAREATLKQLQQLLESEQKRLAEARGQCRGCLGAEGDPDAFSLGASSEGRLAGRGGISEGGGPTELTFGSESDDQAAKFKETVLPPGFFDKPNEHTAGVTASAPKVEPVAAGPRNAAIDSGSTTGKTTWGRQLRPRHREVVQGYFGDG